DFMCKAQHSDSKIEFLKSLGQYKLSTLDLTGCELDDLALKNLLENLKYPESLQELIIDPGHTCVMDKEKISEFRRKYGYNNDNELAEFIVMNAKNIKESKNSCKAGNRSIEFITMKDEKKKEFIDVCYRDTNGYTDIDELAEIIENRLVKF